MISNSLAAEEELLFNSPESLEQLRHELLSMADDHLRTADHLPTDLLALHALLSVDPLAASPLDSLREAQFQLRERSACVVTLAQLAVRLVEGVRQQQMQHLQLLDRYEREAQALRDLNDTLTHRNSHIETDVEYFRQHLQHAESQLEHITALQIEGWESEKDMQIEHLEGELDRIRAELHFYRLRNGSRKSIHSPSQTHLHSVASEHCLREIQIEESEVAALRQTVQALAAENERLRRDWCVNNIGSRQSLHLPCSIREELVEQTERSPVDAISIANFQFDQSYRRSPSTPRLEKEHMLRETSKSLLSPRSRFETEETPLCQTPSQIEMRAHVLSSEWSTKSFDQIDPRPKLIFLQEEEQEKRGVQETKETEQSVREAVQKAVVHVGVNTDQYSTQGTVSDPPPVPYPAQVPSPCQKQPPPDPSLLTRLCRRVVRGRIRRSSVRANWSLLMVGC